MFLTKDGYCCTHKPFILNVAVVVHSLLASEFDIHCFYVHKTPNFPIKMWVGSPQTLPSGLQTSFAGQECRTMQTILVFMFRNFGKTPNVGLNQFPFKILSDVCWCDANAAFLCSWRRSVRWWRCSRLDTWCWWITCRTTTGSSSSSSWVRCSPPIPALRRFSCQVPTKGTSRRLKHRKVTAGHTVHTEFVMSQESDPISTSASDVGAFLQKNP